MISKKAILCGLGFGAALSAGLLVPAIGLFSMFFAMLSGVLGGWAGFGICLLLSGIAGFAISGAGCIPALLMAFIAGGIACAGLKRSAFDALMMSCGGVLASVWAYFFSANLVIGQDFFKLIYEQAPQQYLDTVASLSASSGMDLSMYQVSVAQLQDTLSLTAPSTALIFAMLTGLALVLVGSYIGKRAKSDVCTLPPFILWHLPNSFMWALLLLMLTGYAGLAFGWQGFESVSLATNALFSISLGIQGISTLAFYYRAYNNSALVVLGIVAGVALALMPFTLLGVIDSGFGLRLRYLAEHGLPSKQTKFDYKGGNKR